MGASITKYYMGTNEPDDVLNNILAQFPDVSYSEVDVSDKPQLIRELNLKTFPSLIGIGISGYSLLVHGRGSEQILTKVMRDLVTHEDG